MMIHSKKLREKINRLITEEVFIDVWHEMDGWNCLSCDESVNMFSHPSICDSFVRKHRNRDFFSYEGSMELWVKIQEMDGFVSMTQELHWYEPYVGIPCILQDIHPDRLAPLVYEFLLGVNMEKEKKN